MMRGNEGTRTTGGDWIDMRNSAEVNADLSSQGGEDAPLRGRESISSHLSIGFNAAANSGS